jgi:hypothetical protein
MAAETGPPHESHGNSVAAWVAVSIIMVGTLIGCLGVMASKPWVFFVALAICALGVVAGKVLQLMGLGRTAYHDPDLRLTERLTLRACHAGGRGRPPTDPSRPRGLVLVVEDEKAIADLVRMYLAREGLRGPRRVRRPGRPVGGADPAPGGDRPRRRAAVDGRHRGVPPAARGGRTGPRSSS